MAAILHDKWDFSAPYYDDNQLFGSLVRTLFVRRIHQHTHSQSRRLHFLCYIAVRVFLRCGIFVRPTETGVVFGRFLCFGTQIRKPPVSLTFRGCFFPFKFLKQIRLISQRFMNEPARKISLRGTV